MTADKDALVKDLQYMADEIYPRGKSNEVLLQAIAMLTAPAEAPVAIFHGIVDCCGHGDAYNLDMLKMIARGAKLYAAPLPQSAPVSREAVIEECAKVVPTNWCDPLLTGPESVINHLQIDGCVVERLLKAIAERIRSLAAHPAEPVNEPAGKGE